MAIDEAIVIARIEECVPNTLRFYRWKPSAVSIGRFQDVFNEVMVENCKSHGVDVVRRITGGGTVYHDFEGEITYSVVSREKDLGNTDVVNAYNTICNGLIEAAKILGVKANFNSGDPRNCPNIVVQGKKISGSAQFHRGGVLLQHGTFLLEIDLKKMYTFLRVPWAKTIKDVLCVVQDRLTSIKHETGINSSIEDAYHALVKGFEDTLKLELREESLTDYEEKLAKKLRKKFSTNRWNIEGKI
jgi:lipoate-protein ligase A